MDWMGMVVTTASIKIKIIALKSYTEQQDKSKTKYRGRRARVLWVSSSMLASDPTRNTYSAVTHTALHSTQG